MAIFCLECFVLDCYSMQHCNNVDKMNCLCFTLTVLFVFSDNLQKIKSIVMVLSVRKHEYAYTGVLIVRLFVNFQMLILLGLNGRFSIRDFAIGRS